ncbi:MAG: glucans biosynthesis glucosyltransferase MdoH [Gammaproteobacteria bacterium]
MPANVDDADWHEATARVTTYLRAAGIDDDIAGAILARLHATVPLTRGDDLVEQALRMAAQEAAAHAPRPAAATRAKRHEFEQQATPHPDGRYMPTQHIELGRNPRATGGAASPPARWSGPTRVGTGAARDLLARRLLYGLLVLATTLGATGLLVSSLQEHGLRPLELVLIALYAVLFAWICSAFWTAVLGFVVRITRSRRWNLEVPADATRPSAACRVAIVMPIYEETPEQVFARLRATWESLAATPHAFTCEMFVLSDTRDPDLWVEEELRWTALCRELDASGRIFYRNRSDNVERKAGNLGDFVRRWGNRYDHMVVLDADSLMCGETIAHMVELMVAHPQVGIIQVPAQPVLRGTLFARMQQFAAAFYGPLHVTGSNFWQAGDANYYGHNAIIRVAAFAACCGLPHLPGREPLGGPILSHDFVEAALLRRAGWETWLAPALDGSYEEIPPTLIDYAKRDRRWCQGNLQHARLTLARGWRGLGRLHLAMGAMSYLASPLWLLFLLLAAVDAWFEARETPNYFFAHSLFPVWPDSHAFALTTVLAVTLAILFVPKVLAWCLYVCEPERWREHHGPCAAAASVVLETLFSAIVAPVLMLFQSKFVAAILLRRDVGWPSQQREDHATSLGDALRAHGGQTLVGTAAGIATWLYVPTFFWWFTPVLAGLLLAVPISVLTSYDSLGAASRRRGLFVIPAESTPPAVVARYRTLRRSASQLATGAPVSSWWLAALVHPATYLLHRGLLAHRAPTRREHHRAEGLMFTLLDDSAAALDRNARRTLLTNASCLERVHIGLWQELSLESLRDLPRLRV